MDVSAASGKITDIVLNVNQFVEKMKSIYNKFAKKINGYIDELEKILKKLADLGSKALIWAKMQIKKVLKKIADALNAVQKKINDIVDQIENWYEKKIKKIKISVIKGSMAKLGVSLTDEAAEGMSYMIPHPDIKTLLPTLTIQLEIPGLEEMVSVNGLNVNIKLKKLALL